MIWTRPHETAELLPLDVTVDDAETQNFSVAVVPKYGPRPVTGFSAAVIADGQAGANVQGLAAGDYWAFPKIGTAVLPPIWFRLT